LSRPFNDILKGLRNWQINAEKYVISETKEFEAEIIDMNVKNMDVALDNEGDSFLHKYQRRTIAYKETFGEPYLTDTGDFKDNMMIKFKKDYLALFSTDGKTPKVIEKFGREVFGLDEEKMEELREMVKPNIINRFRKTVFR
jgi:hypothetical protein